MNDKQRALYLHAIEAIGMRVGSRSLIWNKLNKVAAHTEDARLADLIRAVLQRFEETSTNPSALEIRKMNHCKAAAEALEQHCRRMLSEAQPDRRG